MSPEPVRSRFNIHRFTVEVEAVDDLIEGDPGAAPEVTLANEIASNLESLDGIGTVTVLIQDREP